MKILLDHCVDWRLSRALPSHDVKNAARMGWERLRNGKLLAAAAVEFDAMITADQNIRHQQNLTTLPIAVIVMVAKSNKLSDLLPLVPEVEKVIKNLKPGTLVEVGISTP